METLSDSTFPVPYFIFLDSMPHCSTEEIIFFWSTFTPNAAIYFLNARIIPYPKWVYFTTGAAVVS